MTQKHPFIIGKQRGEGTPTLAVTNPYNGEIVGEVYLAGKKEIDRALSIFEKALENFHA